VFVVAKPDYSDSKIVLAMVPLTLLSIRKTGMLSVWIGAA
jgi:hypothetical protein